MIRLFQVADTAEMTRKTLGTETLRGNLSFFRKNMKNVTASFCRIMSGKGSCRISILIYRQRRSCRRRQCLLGGAGRRIKHRYLDGYFAEEIEESEECVQGTQ